MATNNTTKSTNIIRQNVLKHPLASKYINDDWGTIAFLIPRNSIHKDFIEEAFYYSCIYFLIGNKDGKELAYVGQTDKHNNPNKTAMLRIIEVTTGQGGSGRAYGEVNLDDFDSSSAAHYRID